MSLTQPFAEQTEQILLKFLQENKLGNRIFQQGIVTLQSGSGFDDDIQTDGHCPPSSLNADSCSALEGVDEELYRQIAAHLADIGDRLDQSINHDLVEEFIRETERIQPQMDGTIIMSSMITRLTNQRIDAAQDMPQEKVFLLLALMLFKKTVVEKPVLLPRIFRTTVQYINNRLQDYIRNIGGWQNIH